MMFDSVCNTSTESSSWWVTAYSSWPPKSHTETSPSAIEIVDKSTPTVLSRPISRLGGLTFFTTWKVWIHNILKWSLSSPLSSDMCLREFRCVQILLGCVDKRSLAHLTMSEHHQFESIPFFCLLAEVSQKLSQVILWLQAKRYTPPWCYYSFVSWSSCRINVERVILIPSSLLILLSKPYLGKG